MPGAGQDGERRDFFVSYAQSDRGWAEWIAWQLEDAEYTVLLQAWDMVPGSNWLRMMHQATRFAERTIAVLSTAYLDDSAFGEAEWLAAYHRDPKGLASRVIPIRVEDCTPDGLLAGIVYADLVGIADRAAAREAMLAAVRAAIARRTKPLTEPAFPGMSPSVADSPNTDGEPAAGPGGPLGAEAAPPGPSVLGDRSVAAGSVAGSIVVTGDGNVITTGSAAVPARSEYLAQVRQIAPRKLLSRAAELAAMAAFCADTAAGSYVWWRAAAWTGKSALMATFVLEPPAGVRVVSFFITARFAGNSDRAAYVEVVTEQLAELLGLPFPPYLTPAAQERQYWSLLERAAEHCQRHRERLVLLVDGLDEDRSATSGPDAYSIAALLPTDPPAGMRVMVAGRTNPPVPADVPESHPLRDPEIVWLLRRSEHAEAVRATMLADLARLRAGGRLEQDVLGLIAAAGGGLSSRDLAELCAAEGLAVTDWDIEQLLATVVGRSFASRDGRWNPHSNPRLYVLGHEEIQQEAIRSYGETRLATYRQHLHAWADSYRVREWPEGTPEYLLRGYFRLLLATGDLKRAVACATDEARHGRMLDLSGGDTAALAEITEVQNAILAGQRPDLRLLGRLAVHRLRIADRNSKIPTKLPAAWATLGQPDRAVQLARGSGGVETLAALAIALAQTGEEDRARMVAQDAEQAVRDVTTDSYYQVDALAAVVVALAQAGAYDRAERIAHAITGDYQQVEALLGLSTTCARAGEHGRARAAARDAEQIAGGSDEFFQAWALAKVAVALVETGERDRARAVTQRAEQSARALPDESARAEALTRLGAALAQAGEHARAEQIADALTEDFRRAFVLAEVVAALEKAGQHDRARVLAGHVAQIARGIAEESSGSWAVLAAAMALAHVGEYDSADQIARGIADEYRQADTLAEFVTVLAEAGEFGRAERAVHAITDESRRTPALAGLATILVKAGEFGHAERIVHAITDEFARAGTLAGLVPVLVQAGQHDRARGMARDAEQIARGRTTDRSGAWVRLATALARAGEFDRAEQVARTLLEERSKSQALAEVATALADAGEFGRAERIVGGITSAVARAEAFALLAVTLAQAGDFGHARAVAQYAEQAAPAVTDLYNQARVWVELVRAWAEAGDHGRAWALAEHAELVADYIPEQETRVEVLTWLVAALADAGDHGRVRAVAQRAEQGAGAVPREEGRPHLLAHLAMALAGAGDPGPARALAQRAERTARALSDVYQQALALPTVFTALARAGDHDRARMIAQHAEQVARNVPSETLRPAALAALFTALVEAGEYDHAERLAAVSTSEGLPSELLAELSWSLAQAGDHDRARVVAQRTEQNARRMADYYLQAQTLLSLAATWADLGDPDRARNLAAAALSIGSWVDLPLDLFSKAFPSALVGLSDALASAG